MMGGRGHEAVLRYTEAVEGCERLLERGVGLPADDGEEEQEQAVAAEGVEELRATVRSLRCHRAASLLVVQVRAPLSLHPFPYSS